jgi:hypothetical protein
VKGNNKIKCSCTDAVSEERCKTCIAVNHPQYLKVQSELKAIKDRIDGINAEFINKIIEKNYYGKTLVYAVEIAKEIIK